MAEISHLAMDRRFVEADLLTAVDIYLNRIGKGLSDEFGLALNDHRILRRCAASTKPITVGQLATTLYLPMSTVSTCLSRLEKQGLVSRERGSRGNGKLVLASPTTQGETLASRTHELVQSILDDLMEPMGLSSRETIASFAVKNMPAIDSAEFDLTDLYINYISRYKYFITLSTQPFRVCADDYRILISLDNSQDGLSPADLAWGLLMAPSRLSQRLRILEKRELLLRAANPLDRRSKIASITPQGVALVAAIGQALDAYRLDDMGEPSDNEVRFYTKLSLITAATFRAQQHPSQARISQWDGRRHHGEELD